MIKFPCPECQARLKCDAAAAGKRIKCPKCSTPVRIPHESAPDAPEALEEVIPVAEPKKISKVELEEVVPVVEPKKISKVELEEVVPVVEPKKTSKVVPADVKKTSKVEREQIAAKPR